MVISIRAALPVDAKEIRRIHQELRRPRRAVRVSEYLVAVGPQGVVGCAAVRIFSGGGYLYGLAVQRKSQKSGVGSALTRARVDVIRERNQKLVVVLAMFWNVAFFRKLGFQSVGRDQLPAAVRRLADFQNSKYKHSATLWQSLEIDH